MGFQGSVGKQSIAPVPSAAHVRTMRKGSADHLALSIDVESDPLIGNQGPDEDKGTWLFIHNVEASNLAQCINVLFCRSRI